MYEQARNALQTHGYDLRPPTPADAPGISALIAACDTAQYGSADVEEPADIVAEWGRIDLTQDAWVIVAANAQIVGYATVMQRVAVRYDTDGYVHPAHQQRGIGTALVRLSEARARVLAEQAPTDAPILLHNAVIETDSAARALLERAGYTIERGFWRMSITLDAVPPPPELPPQLSVRTALPGHDDFAIFTAVEEAFQDHWGHMPGVFERWQQRSQGEGYDPTLWFLAMDGVQIAGMALCRQQYGGGWVNTLGVRRPWRRLGLGQALLHHTFREFYQRGITRVALGVDAQSLTGATRLYERVGMQVIMRITVYKKALRGSASSDAATTGQS